MPGWYGGVRVCLVMAVVRALIYNLIWEPFLVSCQTQSTEWISQTQLTGIIQMFHIQWNFFYCGNWIDFLNWSWIQIWLREDIMDCVDIMRLLLSYHRPRQAYISLDLSAFPDRLRKNRCILCVRETCIYNYLFDLHSLPLWQPVWE